MPEQPKFKTFKDTRNIAVIPAKETSTSAASITSIPSRTRDSSSTSIGKKNEISPVRDFQKVPNSVSRNLDLFRGKSKQVWDYLWSVSRGAINPSRTVRKSRKEIKEGAKVGSMVTVDAAIGHLITIGLLKVARSVGSLKGNEYEIFSPEEIDLSYTSSTSIASNTSLTQKVDELDILESSNTSRTQTIVNKDSYGFPKTSLKTNTNDDEAFRPFNEKLTVAVQRITGKKPTARDAQNWSNLADLLILQLDTAARNTNDISNVPAFLTEVLRRKLLNVQSAKPSKAKIDTIGKSEPDSYEIIPLDRKGREAALEQLREFAADEFLEDFRKWYTEEDWSWLIKQLEIES